MRNFFNYDNPLFQFLGKIADLMLLNLLFLLCSLPVVTIGPSLTALYYVTLKIAEGEEGYIARSFFKSFRQNFKQAVLMWLMVLALVLVLFLDYRIMGNASGSVSQIMLIAITASSLIFFMVFVYLFPNLARFYNSIPNTFRNAALMAVANLPLTFLIVVICIAPVVITFINGYTLWYGILFWILIGFSLVALLNSYLFVRIFARYAPKDSSESDPDFWCVEDEDKGSDGSDGSDGSEKSDL